MNNFQFENFKPTPELALYANTVLIRLMDYIPDGAVSTAVLKKEKHKFSCLLEVQGRRVTFFEDQSSADPKTAIDSTSEKMREQMLEWQSERIQLTEPTFWNFKEVRPKNEH